MFMAKMFTAQEPGTVEYKIWKTYNGILFRDKKRNELSSHERTRRNCKYTLLSQRSQPEKAMYCMNATWHSGKGKTRETV